jgi:hypothetical protein
MSNPLYNNVNNNHPLITNSQDYALLKKYVSIHSEDRDFLKYPNASQFEIELPEDLLNVSTVKVSDWQFPLTYDVYSVINNNITMTFKINKPINPSTIIPPPLDLVLQTEIFEALTSNIDNNFTILIQIGTYTGIQLSYELTNKFNEVVTVFLKTYLDSHYPGNTFTSYNEFIIEFNIVSNNMWFGNKSSGFVLTNTTQIPFEYSMPSTKNCNPCKPNPSTIYSKLPKSAIVDPVECYRKNLPDSYVYGLPYYLGLIRCDMESVEADKVSFYYTIPPLGAWLSPTYPGTKVYFVTAPKKCILTAPVYIYLEIEGLNCIDETSPFNISKFTLTTNETNGVVNSALAKLYVPPSNNSWYDKAPTYKFFMPPAERIRKLKLKFRYHDGQLVNFDGLPYTILLEFTLFTPQQVRKQNVYNPQTGK